MKKTALWFTFLLSSALFLAFVGCSDDDKETTKTYTDGDETSEEFEALDNGAEGALELTESMLDGAIVIADLILDDTANPNAGKIDLLPAFSLHDSVPVISFTKDFRESSGDWLVSLTIHAHDSTDTLSLTYTDSMTFFHGDSAVQWPDSASLTGIQNGMSLVVEAVSGGVAKANHGGIFAGHTWSIAGDSGEIASRGNVALQGSGYCDIEFEFEIEGEHTFAQDANHATCEGLFDFSLNINGLALNVAEVEEGVCPTGGSINFGGEVDVACFADSSGFEVQGEHTVDVQFTGDSTLIVIRSGDTEWKISEACAVATNPTSAKNWLRIADLLVASKRK